MKLLADIGLIGLPNAGKSTLLSKLSAAHPKVASYPFTTLEPQLGVLLLPEDIEGLRPSRFIIADIPGLIEGAHQGAGLGHKFLRHIERTRVLLHVLDVSGSEQKPIDDYQVLENELRCYNEALLDLHRLVVLNKVDLLDDQDRLAWLSGYFAGQGVEAVAVSAMTGAGLDRLKELLVAVLQPSQLETQPVADEAAEESEP